MSGCIYLGELEELILLMVALRRTNAYGVSITDELKEQTGLLITTSAPYAAPHRLEKKRFVKSESGRPSMERVKRLVNDRHVSDELRDIRRTIWPQIPM